MQQSRSDAHRATNALWSRVHSAPLWARAIGAYLLIRALIIPAFVVAWQAQGPNRSSYPDASPGFLEFLASSWDGYWYLLIALDGYPADLPRDADTGVVEKNAWAFFPLFPFTVRAVMTVTRLPWEIAGTLVAFVIGAAASVVIAYLVRDGARIAVQDRPGLPILAVVAVNAFPTAATMTTAYTESTALLLIALSLLLIVRHRYLWAALPIVGLGFTRAVALPLAVVIAWHAWNRLRGLPGGPQRVRALIALPALFVLAIVSGFAWPLIVGWRTGTADAYFQTQSAWRLGDSASTPFLGFAARLDELAPGFSIPLLVAAVAAIVALSFTRRVRALGPELQAWGGSYVLYLLAVGTLSSSLPRFLLLSITLPLLLVSWWRNRFIGYGVVVLLLIVQYAWVLDLWVFVPGDNAP